LKPESHYTPEFSFLKFKLKVRALDCDLERQKMLKQFVELERLSKLARLDREKIVGFPVNPRLLSG